MDMMQMHKMPWTSVLTWSFFVYFHYNRINSVTGRNAQGNKTLHTNVTTAI